MLSIWPDSFVLEIVLKHLIYVFIIDLIVLFFSSDPNDFYTNIDSMPEIKIRPKSIPLVSDLVSNHGNCMTHELNVIKFVNQC